MTNDAFAPAPRAAPVAGPPEPQRAAAASRAAAVPARRSSRAAGRSPSRCSADAPAHGTQMRAQAELLLERYGIVTREAVLAEGVPGGFASLYGGWPIWRRSAPPAAATSSRASAARSSRCPPLSSACAACARTSRPARWCSPPPIPPTPTGPRCPGPSARTRSRRPRRVPGAYVVTLDAEPVLYVERGGKGLLPLGDPAERAPAPGAGGARRARAPRAHQRLGIERYDGEPVVGSPVGALLIELGFRQGPRQLTLSA